MKLIIKLLTTILLIGIFTVGCSANENESDTNADFTIYTSIYPIQYAAERIGGNSITVKTILPPGVDAHTYEPTSKDLTKLAKSDAFIYLGAGMEGFSESIADALDSEDVALIELGGYQELFHTDGNPNDDGHQHGDRDPHIWLDPIRMTEMSRIIKDELVALNPDMKERYSENFINLIEDLTSLDDKFKEVLLEKTNKKILVSHAAFGYWEEQYGIEQIAINGLSSSSEPSQKELTEIIDQAKKYKLNYIIFEQNSSNRVSEIIQAAIGAEALTIHNLAVLTENDINNKEDYLSLMNHNLEVLDKATDNGKEE